MGLQHPCKMHLERFLKEFVDCYFQTVGGSKSELLEITPWYECKQRNHLSHVWFAFRNMTSVLEQPC